MEACRIRNRREEERVRSRGKEHRVRDVRIRMLAHHRLASLRRVRRRGGLRGRMPRKAAHSGRGALPVRDACESERAATP